MAAGRGLFSLFPPAFAAVPQYFAHTKVELLPLTEPDLWGAHGYGEFDAWREMVVGSLWNRG